MSLTGYSTTQVRLHWIIAGLLLLQVAFHDGIQAAANALNQGEPLSGGNQLLADVHIFLGLTILVLAVIRLRIRRKQGVPDLPEDEKPALKLLARLTHIVLYAVILLMPVSGSLAWFGGVEIAATLHSLAKPFLLLFVFLHIAGAIFQHFVLKTDVLRRMINAEKQTE